MVTRTSSPDDSRPPSGGRGDGEPERPLNVLDALVFAPLGLALRAGELLPTALRQGRVEYDKRAATAKLLGKLIVTQQQRKRRLARASSPAIASRQNDKRADHGHQVSPANITSQAVPKVAPSAAASGQPQAAADLSIEGYDTLPARSLLALFDGLSAVQLADIRRYELDHRRRETVLARLTQLQNGAEGPLSG